MDHAQFLRNEVQGSHAQFHQFVLALSEGAHDDQYFFFEGDDDPVFYVGQSLSFLNAREYHIFICRGRSDVLKVHELVARDGRASERSHFFIDRDHNDILASPSDYPASVFQTRCYSFENYLVCDRVVRRFWVERLHLPSTDARLTKYVARFHAMHTSLMKRLRLLMALVLVGRGIEGREPLKLNLNNVNLDKVLKLDAGMEQVRWMPNAVQHFLAASNMIESGLSAISAATVRHICKKYLSGDAKTYVRGKYELWFFVKFLMATSRELSDKKVANASGLARAKPKEPLTFTNSIMHLSPLAPCPADLSGFLLRRLGAPHALQ